MRCKQKLSKKNTLQNDNSSYEIHVFYLIKLRPLAYSKA